VANGYIRDNPRYPVIARTLDASGLATVTIRLLTPSEAAKDEHTGYWSFDLELLSHRIREATHWVSLHPRLRELDIGFLGSGTGAAAALVVAAQLGAAVHAVVSRGGRPDLGRDYLPRVTASTLLIVGEKDEAVCDLNRQAFSQLLCPKEMTIVAGSDHLFGEAGALEKVASLAAAWFAAHLRSGTRI
jgi:pimeloyl-ACP methyl ester carboxylesterase